MAEIPRPGEGDPHAVARVSAIRDDEFSLEQRHARVFYTKFLISGKGALRRRPQKWFRIRREVKAVGAARQADDGSTRAQMRAKKHDVFVAALHYRRVMDGFDGIRN